MHVAMGNAFAEQQINFLKNQARPSAVLSTDLMLDRTQLQALRDRFNEQAKGMHRGGTPILTGGLKVQPWGTPAKDAQLAELMELSDKHIAHAFNIPLQLLGLANAPFSSTQELIRFWLSNSLGFALQHIEEAFGLLFDLKSEPEDYLEFDTAALLRSDPKDKIEMLVRGIQGGLYSPNEARASEALDAVPFGDEPRVQAQTVPLSAAAAIPTAPVAAVQPAAPAATAADYHAAVEREAAALRTRTGRRAARTDNISFGRRAAAPRSKPMIGKTKANAHHDARYAEKSMQQIIGREKKMNE
jgi:hypothetical protein